MKFFSRFRTQRGLQALGAALLLVLLIALPALAQSGITFYTGLGVVSDGTITDPSYTFYSDVDTGLYRIGTNNLGVTAGGAKVLDVATTGLGVTGSLSTTNGGNIVAPTAVGTATPALIVNSSGVSNLFEARKNSTPVASIDGTGIATLANGLTVTTGTVALPASEIGATEIANVSRAINVPLTSLIECTTDAGALLSVTDGSDTHPHLANSSTNGLGAVLRFDDSTPDTDYVCGQLMVPPDYASGGAFIVRALKDAVTGANTEILNCAGSINGAALGTGGTVTITTQASTAYTCTPTLTSLAVNDSVSFEFHVTSSGTIDDVTDVAGIEFTYTATQ